ncbi:flavin monoamine oxidase family protein [Gillisia hiemivivida]|uniref:FAD-dependent oxidoreductase n=1 Tax=Gillisia hiemivivida TaxID=291190 RepID=A0A5C6ZQL6_9FLAO|nr:NAD(P)/FAD-dependent oxidoreductase [Gillisia hiemivivida]TXD91931.1 FAD-dependent oxidoreductase [Gillisia hiemivivida]
MILIIGAGLSGLLTAYRLKKEGIPFKILEARPRVGGRINTVYGKDNTPVEMGATWFGAQHTYLKALLEELGIEYFEQYMDGTVFFQPFSTSPAESIQIPSQPPSYRISGGSSNLINTLYQKLDEKDIILNQSVKEIKFHNNSVQVITNEVFEGNRVVLAIPPKLWAKKILFEPNLPENLISLAEQTQTWMEDSIKIALTYKQAFWQQADLSGTLFSNTGPITELYDHCDHERSKYALCGFINSSFKQLTYKERRAKVIDQIKNVFGEKAEDFIDYEECIWSKEENTFEASDIALYPHQNNGNPIFSKSFFDDKLLISSSEAASEFPGYMEGAVYSANITAKKIITANVDYRK